jgi:glycosyltransferase involved in cell wall biosynthesis
MVALGWEDVAIAPGGSLAPGRFGTIAVVIPAFNEANTIRDIASGALACTPNVVVVDDGSTDGTADALDGLPVTLLRHPENRGKAAALMRGLGAAMDHDVEGVVTLDGDGQHLPSDIRRLVRAARLHPEHLVIGSRLHDGAKFPPARLAANRIANFWISWAAGQRISDTQSGFRFYPAALLRAVDWADLNGDGFVFESEILIHAAECGYSSTSVDIPALYDREYFRPSHFRPLRDITAIVRMVAWSLVRRGMYPVGLYRSLFPNWAGLTSYPKERPLALED